MSAPKIDDADSAAAAFEAYFLRRVLAEVRTGQALTGGGFAGDMFKEMMDEALADAMAKAGGVGLADAVAAQLDPDAQPAAPAAPGFMMPIAGATTSSFGARRDPFEGDVRQHQGIDLRAPEGTPVRVAAGGVVKFAGVAGGYGNLVTVDHGNGLETRYAHLSAIDVEPGQRIPIGTQVGLVGQTGRATGPHLHFEVRRDGQALDPTDQLSALKFRNAWPNQ